MNMDDYVPINYNLQLIPNLSTFKFKGLDKIKIKKNKYNPNLILNVKELEISSVKLVDSDISLDHEISMENETLTISIPEDVKDEFTLEIKYTGEHNEQLSGFYRSKFMLDGKEKFCVVTHFQENEARRAFPCFDEPNKKATFDIEIITDLTNYVISNTSVKSHQKVGKNQKSVKFETTPPMSTYLVFFGVGEFEFIEGQLNDVIIKFIASPGKAKEYGEFGLDYGIKSLQYCEKYFGIEYPLSKLDLIATPDFAAGAMENWGAILFREDLLFFIPGVTSQARKKLIREVISHEISHQWFGNLVSPYNWNYSWLNESFATFFSYGVMDHYDPDLRVWEIFVSNTTNIALFADSFLDTTPIELETGEKIGFTLKTVPIIYHKGGSILRQLKEYLGEKNFQKGLRKYFDNYLYGNAKSSDLWNSLEEATKEPISELMISWILQEGHPVIETELNEKSISFKQSRFTFLENESTNVWYVPITGTLYYLNKDPVTFKFILKDKEEKLDVETTNLVTYKLNNDHTGFYRVHYTDSQLNKLGELSEEGLLSTIDRWNLLNDVYGFVLSGIYKVEKYLDFINYFNDEDTHLPVRAISSHLNTFYDVFDDPIQSKIKKKGAQFCEMIISKIGFVAKKDEDYSITTMRPQLIQVGAKLESKKIIDFVLSEYEKLKNNEQISADLKAIVLLVAAKQKNEFDWMLNKFETASNEVDIVNFGNALSNFSDSDLIEKVKDLVFTKIPGRNCNQSVIYLCANDKAKKSMWEWYLANLDSFEKLHPNLYESAVNAIILADPEKESEVSEFFMDYVKKNSKVKDSVERALETLKVRKNVRSLNS